ncbi:MAG: RecQ family ATP-dependent DNA helicase [Candidatus Cyclobacteriaceae bacterium M3_2C_046]
MEPVEILRKYWGYEQFRPLQEDIIRSVIAGNDTLALLPTGGGKSICFQVPGLMLEGICLVISPLIALMKDQVEQLKKRNIPAAAIYSGLTQREIDILLDNCIYGNIKFLYVSPERLKTELFIERVKKMKVGLLAVDEAHCISQWGYDFRPPYLEIADFRQYLPEAEMIALTATATGEVKADIQEKLNFRQNKVFQKSFARANLSYAVRFEEDKEKKLIEVIQKVPGTAIVYVRSRKRTLEIARFLSKHKISADFYHAGLTNEERSVKQDRWIKNKTRVIVSTNAFGMGIDKPDVRLVVHMDLPENLEAYYQEAGRAGRDEKKAYALILVHEKDILDLQKKVLQSTPSVEYLRKVYQCLANYYKIAVGSNLLTSYDFDLNDFSKTYKLNLLEAYQAIKKLEMEGLIQLNQTFYNPSKLYFSVDKKNLYQFQVANAQLDNVIKALLRLYGGEIFSGFQKISEPQLAKMLHITTKEVEEKLQYLHQTEIAIYDKMKEKPQLTFITPRFDASKLPIDKNLLEHRRQNAIQKMEAVVHYVKHQFRCRTQLLLEYFEEISYQKCGVCDICVSQKKTIFQSEQLSQTRKDLLDLLNEREYPVNELIRLMPGSNRETALSIIRRMIDNQELLYTRQGNLKKNIKN